MTERITYDGGQFTIDVDALHPDRACGGDITITPYGMTDERGHTVGYVHLREYAAAVAAVGIVHTMHAPSDDGRCRVCDRPAPCETRSVTAAAMKVQP